MPSPLASHLAERFASDARALRARADALQGRSTRGPGPTAAVSTLMADACERVHALFVGAESDDAVRALVPTLAGLVAGARTESERHVYAGAVARASQALDGDDGADADDDDLDDPDDLDDGSPELRS